MSVPVELPLAGIRVVDMVSGPLAVITRYLADLGATVDRIEPVISPDERDRFDDIADNAGKIRHAFAPDSEAAERLLASADVIVGDTGANLAGLRAARPSLVTMTVSDFGQGNSLSEWQATDAVLHALSGELCRSGIKGMPPLLPPHGIAYQCAATQAAYTLLVAIYSAIETGIGDALDFVALEGAVQALDPGYGVGGSATLGRPAKRLSRQRPPRGYLYPILRCGDGYVRICLLAPRQWHGMFRWMGSPPAFANPALDHTEARYRSPDLVPAIASFFADKSQAQLVEEGQAHGVPIAALASFGDAMESDHFQERGALCAVSDEGLETALPNGVIVIDGTRMSAIKRAQPPVAGNWRETISASPPGSGTFTGLRILDLGVIVVGAETGRLFADQGADVVKVESRAFPDGNRRSYLPYDLSVGFAAGHRNKRSLGLDLRDPRGKALFLRLLAQADILLSNFRPGTMESLGLDPQTLQAANPGLVAVESSAFGGDGAWSRRMGYGPLVRAATGLTDRWRYPEHEDDFGDSLTIYPDHAAARVGAMAAIALLIRRMRTGKGGRADIAQAEVMFGHFAADIARSISKADTEGARDRPWGVYGAAGDDAWCTVTVRGDSDWAALAPLLGLEADEALNTRAGRVAATDRLDRALARWMADHDPHEAAAMLQKSGVPAAPMLRIAELPDYSFYRERAFYRVEVHPYLDEHVIAERRHITGCRDAPLPERPAPLGGEQTVEVVSQWLDLSEAERDELIEADVLQPTDAALYERIEIWRSDQEDVLKTK